MTNRRQKATRFYAALLQGNNSNEVDMKAGEKDVAPHRYSSDTSGKIGKIENADHPESSIVKIYCVLSDTISISVSTVNRIPIDCINLSF